MPRMCTDGRQGIAFVLLCVCRLPAEQRFTPLQLPAKRWQQGPPDLHDVRFLSSWRSGFSAASFGSGLYQSFGEAKGLLIA